MNGKYKYRGRIRFRNAMGHYHCISRIVGGQPLLRQREKEVFRRMLRKQAQFCGIDVLTFAIMSNHFHLLVRVVPQDILSDREMIERVRVLYGDDGAEVAANRLASGENGPEFRERLIERMGDVSVFLKELKQRFSIWYNQTHDRFGTLWAERFKSILVQGEDHALAAVAAYIDLNPLRAGMCKDPKDYRFCGYAEAVAGRAEAREGLNRVFGSKDWRRTQSAYRLVLFGNGYHTPAGKGKISEAALRRVWKEKGELSLTDLLRCRVRFFSDGLALGTAEFVDRLFDEVKEKYGWKKRKRGARPMDAAKPDGLCVLNRMRGTIIG